MDRQQRMMLLVLMAIPVLVIAFIAPRFGAFILGQPDVDVAGVTASPVPTAVPGPSPGALSSLAPSEVQTPAQSSTPNAVPPISAGAPPTPSLSGSPVASGRPATRVVPERMASSPEDAVLAFYQAVSGREFTGAAAFWTDRMRAAYPPEVNINQRFDQTDRIEVESARVTALDDAAGHATVDVRLVETRSSSSESRTLSGQWHLVRTAAGWRLDQPNF